MIDVRRLENKIQQTTVIVSNLKNQTSWWKKPITSIGLGIDTRWIFGDWLEGCPWWQESGWKYGTLDWVHEMSQMASTPLWSESNNQFLSGLNHFLLAPGPGPAPAAPPAVKSPWHDSWSPYFCLIAPPLTLLDLRFLKDSSCSNVASSSLTLPLNVAISFAHIMVRFGAFFSSLTELAAGYLPIWVAFSIFLMQSVARIKISWYAQFLNLISGPSLKRTQHESVIKVTERLQLYKPLASI